MRTTTTRQPSGRRRSAGQSMAEFAVVLLPLMILFMAIFDLGRAIYMMNGTAEAAREIARVTSVHPYDTCCDLASSSRAQAVVGTQRTTIPSLVINTSSDVTCVDVTDAAIADTSCRSGDFVKVRVQAQFQPITPIVGMFGSHTLESISRVKIP